jgi:hypothetical protein
LNSIPEVYVITENNPKGIKNFKRNIDRLNLIKLKTRKNKRLFLANIYSRCGCDCFLKYFSFKNILK